jgi:hypothetical protein
MRLVLQRVLLLLMALIGTNKEDLGGKIVILVLPVFFSLVNKQCGVKLIKFSQICATSFVHSGFNFLFHANLRD